MRGSRRVAEFKMCKTLFLTLLATACRPTGQRPSPPAAVREEQLSTAERVVRLQYDAYNRHDFEAFVAAHSPDARVYQYPTR
jgi:hypothetical protein